MNTAADGTGPTGRQQEAVLATDNPFCAWNQHSLTAGTWSEPFSIYPTTWQAPGSGPAALYSLPCVGIPVQWGPGCSWTSMFVARPAGSCWPGAFQGLCPYCNSNNTSRYFRVLEIHESDLKASPPRPRASGQMFEGFCGQTAHHFLLQEKQQQDWTKSVLKQLPYNRGHSLHHVTLNETEPEPQHKPYTAPRHKALVFYFSAVYLPLNSEKYYL